MTVADGPKDQRRRCPALEQVIPCLMALEKTNYNSSVEESVKY